MLDDGGEAQRERVQLNPARVSPGLLRDTSLLLTLVFELVLTKFSVYTASIEQATFAEVNYSHADCWHARPPIIKRRAEHEPPCQH